MIRVLYDKQIFNNQKFGGISRYFAELLKGINRTPGFKSIPKKYFSENKHLQFNNLTYLDAFRDKLRFRGKARIENYIIKRETDNFNKAFKEGNFDIFHPTYYAPLHIERLPETKPFVLTVFDMIHELYFNKHTNVEQLGSINKAKLIPKATHIVAISQNTKDDILRFYPSIDKDKITVSHLASSLSANKRGSKIKLPAKYILFVGNRGYYKNFNWLLQSISRYLIKNGITLACAGGGNFNEEERALIIKTGSTDHIKFFDINNDDDLVTLYTGAICFVFPSLFEGFGIPILEAFSCSCPVVVPATSCFPEIAGESALYYEPGNEQSLVGQFENILNDAQLTSSLKTSGLNRLKLFSWEKTVEDHIKIYSSLCVR